MSCLHSVPLRQVGAAFDAGDVRFFACPFNDGINIVAKTTFFLCPALRCFVGKSTRTEMNDFGALGLQYFGQSAGRIPRTSARENTREHTLVIDRESLFLLPHTSNAVRHGTSVHVLLTSNDGNFRHFQPPLGHLEQCCAPVFFHSGPREKGDRAAMPDHLLLSLRSVFYSDGLSNSAILASRSLR